MKIHILVACLFAVVAADDNIVQLAKKLGANELVKLVQMAGLEETLMTGGPFTVFAPTDAAFGKVPKAIIDRLMKDKKLLADLLMYHVVSGSVYSSSLENEQLAPSLLKVEGKDIDIRINIYKKTPPVVTATGSPIVMVDQNATNGVIHVLDRVMFPVPLMNIPEEVTRQKERFSTLLKAVEVAKLATTLAGGPFTLFAPTNEAFAKIPTDTLNKLLANVTALTDVLTYHVVSGTVYSAGLSNGDMPDTVEGKKLTVNIGAGGVMINTAKVQEADVAVTNGVIHVIDAVLLPPAFNPLDL